MSGLDLDKADMATALKVVDVVTGAFDAIKAIIAAIRDATDDSENDKLRAKVATLQNAITAISAVVSSIDKVRQATAGDIDKALDDLDRFTKALTATDARVDGDIDKKFDLGDNKGNKEH